MFFKIWIIKNFSCHVVEIIQKRRHKRSTKPKTTIEELERENLKLQIEIERLKKGYITKEVGAKYVIKSNLILVFSNKII